MLDPQVVLPFVQRRVSLDPEIPALSPNGAERVLHRPIRVVVCTSEPNHGDQVVARCAVGCRGVNTRRVPVLELGGASHATRDL